MTGRAPGADVIQRAKGARVDPAYIGFWDARGRNVFLETGTTSPVGRCGKPHVIGFLDVHKVPRCEDYERQAFGTICLVDLAATHHLGRQFGQLSAPSYALIGRGLIRKAR